MAPTKRKHRSPEEQIADLEAKIAQVKQRAERQRAKKDPTIRHVTSAIRAIDKALGVAEDSATREGLDEARATLAAVLRLNGAEPKTESGTRMRRGGQAREEEILRQVQDHPGSRCEDIARALGADTKAVSPVLKRLKEEGRVRSKGQARGTRYFA